VLSTHGAGGTYAMRLFSGEQMPLPATFITGGSASTHPNQNTFISIGELGSNATEASIAATYPSNATIDQLYVFAEGNINNVTVTVFINGSATGITCSYSNTSICTDNTHTATISAGQTISIKITVSNSGQALHFRMRSSPL